MLFLHFLSFCSPRDGAWNNLNKFTLSLVLENHFNPFIRLLQIIANSIPWTEKGWDRKRERVMFSHVLQVQLCYMHLFVTQFLFSNSLFEHSFSLLSILVSKGKEETSTSCHARFVINVCVCFMFSTLSSTHFLLFPSFSVPHFRIQHLSHSLLTDRLS